MANQEHEEADINVRSCHHLGRKKQKSPQGIQPQSEQDPRLVSMFFNEQSRRNGKAAITKQVAGHLDPCGFRIAYAHDPLKCGQHGIGQVVGNCPGKKQGCK